MSETKTQNLRREAGIDENDPRPVYTYEDPVVFEKPDLPTPYDSKKKENKGKWKWEVTIQPVMIKDPPNAGRRIEHPIIGFTYEDDPNANPILVYGAPFPVTLSLQTGTREQEFELIDQLTTDVGAVHGTKAENKLMKVLKHQPDGLYRLTFYKQTVASQHVGKNEMYAYWGWNLVSKHGDIILMETRYIQNGFLDKFNLETRDAREDTRRKHPFEIPSGGVDYVW